MKHNSGDDHIHIKNANLKAINGVEKIGGMVTFMIEIFDIGVDKENFDVDFLIGLDCRYISKTQK